MSRLKTLLCTLLFILPTAIAQAGDDNLITDAPQPIPNKHEGMILNRPLAPSNMRIYFLYDASNSDCIFTLRDDIEYISVTLEHTATHMMYFGDVDASDPVMHQPLERGVYHISCVTDNGAIYAGEIVI